ERRRLGLTSVTTRNFSQRSRKMRLLAAMVDFAEWITHPFGFNLECKCFMVSRSGQRLRLQSAAACSPRGLSLEPGSERKICEDSKACTGMSSSPK
ncbi:hypothetical protein ATANTOWER_029947, partial [Ataeniobius toweri]|nr:hypothetical protein [Ataeniobius toweri]